MQIKIDLVKNSVKGIVIMTVRLERLEKRNGTVNDENGKESVRKNLSYVRGSA
jgi:hypothetical protein